MHTFIYIVSARQRGSEAGRRDLGAAAGCVLASVYIKNNITARKTMCIPVLRVYI